MTIVITSLSVICYFAFLHYTFKKRWRFKEGFLLLLLIAYLIAVILITVGFRTYNNDVELNLKPFSTYTMMFQRTIDNFKVGNYSEAWQEFIWIGYVSWSCVILNVLLFVPLGYLLPLSLQRISKWYGVLLCGIGISLIIEMTQITTHRGWFDVDDIIHNGFGTFIGWCCYQRWLSPLIYSFERSLCDENSK